MPISAANLKWYLSGGATNTDPNASLGGARSTTEVGASLNNLFDDVNSTEATNGDVEYRCIYFRNEDADADGLITGVIWIPSNTPSPNTTIDIGVVGTKNATADIIANESTAPSGITFYPCATLGAALPLPGSPMVQNDTAAIWVRRTVTAGAGSASNDPCTLRVEGSTV